VTETSILGLTVFKDKILNGEKRQTIRKARKTPIKVGDTLYLYWILRTKQCELLKVVKCTESTLEVLGSDVVNKYYWR